MALLLSEKLKARLIETFYTQAEVEVLATKFQQQIPLMTNRAQFRPKFIELNVRGDTIWASVSEATFGGNREIRMRWIWQDGVGFWRAPPNAADEGAHIAYSSPISDFSEMVSNRVHAWERQVAADAAAEDTRGEHLHEAAAAAEPERRTVSEYEGAGLRINFAC